MKFPWRNAFYGAAVGSLLTNLVFTSGLIHLSETWTRESVVEVLVVALLLVLDTLFTRQPLETEGRAVRGQIVSIIYLPRSPNGTVYPPPPEAESQRPEQPGA